MISFLRTYDLSLSASLNALAVGSLPCSLHIESSGQGSRSCQWPSNPKGTRRWRVILVSALTGRDGRYNEKPVSKEAVCPLRHCSWGRWGRRPRKNHLPISEVVLHSIIRCRCGVPNTCDIRRPATASHSCGIAGAACARPSGLSGCHETGSRDGRWDSETGGQRAASVVSFLGRPLSGDFRPRRSCSVSPFAASSKHAPHDQAPASGAQDT
jgi:hypothetical protein